MANKVTIDVEARFVDKMSGEAQAAASSIEGIGKEAEKAVKKTDKLNKEKVKPKVDADTGKFIKKIREAEDKARKFGNTKTEKVLRATDKASAVINKVISKSKSVAGKVWTAVLKVKDSQAVSALKNIGNYAKSFAGKTWTTLVKIKDLATSPLKKIKDSLFSIKTLISAIAAGWAAKQFILNPINVADAYSSANISFSTLLGKDQGQQMMDDLDQFAKATPFNTTNVISNAQKMLAMGWEAEDIIKDMEVIGNAAAATGKLDTGLESIVRALSQIKTKGRLSTEELNQLAEAGIAAKAMLAEQLGYGTGDEGIAKMTEDLEEGAIASDKAIEALLAGMKKYDGMMDSMANETVEGLWSQLQDVFNINIVRKWGQGLQDGAKQGLGTILNLLDSSEGALKEFGDIVYRVGKTFSNWAADKLEDAVAKIREITGSEAFQNASLGGKIKLLWKGLIANPFSKWWSDTVVPWWDGVAVPWLAEKAGKIGETIGKGLSDGLLALLGVDVVGAVEDGASIAGSFVKGFTDGFDGSAIADAFTDAFSRIWDAMPWWAKALLFGYGASKIGNLVGGLMSLFGNVSTVLGSASAGTGLLGLGAKAGVKMGAGGYIGKYAAGTGVGLGTSLLGLSSTAGLIYGGATAISGGIDLYNGYKNDDETAKKSGWWKVGGVAGGAAAGAAIGSAIPVVGTLVGAGIGALAGGLLGNWGADKVQQEAAEKAEKLANAEAEAAAKAAKIKAEMKELAKIDMAKHFGDIALSAEEVKTAVNSMIGQEAIERAYAASEAISQMDASLQSFNNADSALKKELWLTGLKKNARLTDAEISGLKNSYESFSQAAETYLKDAQYASSESITALLGNSEAAKKVLDASTDYYDDQRRELSELSGQLSDELKSALADKVISIDEQKSIDSLRAQISAVMKQIQDDEYQASLNTIKAKYGTSDISVDSFKDMVRQMENTASEMTDGFWDQFGRGSIGLKEGSDEWNALLESTLGEISGVWETAGNLGLDKLQTKWSDELGIFGKDIASTLKTKTSAEIIGAASGISKDTRASIGEWLDVMKPTTEQIQAVVKAYEDLGKEPPAALQEYLNSVAFYEALAGGMNDVRSYLSTYYQNNPVEMDIDAFVESIDYKLKTDPDKWADDFDYAELLKVEAEAYVGIDWTYDKFDDEWISPSQNYSFSTEALVEAGWTYNEFEEKWISPDGKYSFNTTGYVNVDYQTEKFNGTMTEFGIKSSYEFNTMVKLGTTLVQDGFVNEGDMFRGGMVGGDNIPGYAGGGMVRGGAQLVKVAEEGTPEMIIPLGSQRRDRALKLWAKTGEMLGVNKFARGGRTNGNDEGIRFNRYDADDSAGSQSVIIEVGGIHVEINVNAQDSENIAEAIKAQANEIAETLAGIMADSLGSQFENTPVTGGAA